MPDIGISVGVYHHSDPMTLIDVLNGRIKPSALEELKGVGGGDITISLHDPKVSADPTLIQPRNVLKISVAGKEVGALVIGKKTSQVIDDTPDAEIYQISGEGLRTWFNGATVYPSGGLKKTSFDTRAFNFASEQGEWYDPAQWVAPTNVVAWGDVVGSPWRYAPAEWPDVPLAQWVWSSNSISSAPAGDNFFRYEFDVAVAFQYSFFLAADDQYSVYIDGQLVAQSDPATSAFTEVERIDTNLDVGHHVIGVRVTNNTAGPAAFIAALFYYGDPLVPTSATLVTYTGKAGDSNWKVAGYPNPVPGWSPGEIMRILLEEAETRGVRFPLWLTPTFTDSEDSYGNEWERSLDWSFSVGDTLASVLDKLEELVCDAWIDPATLEFHMAKERGIDRSIYHYDVDGVTPISVPVIFQKGYNLGSSSVDSVSEIANALVVSTADGWMEIDDDTSTSISTYGRIEAQLDTGVSSAVSTAVAGAVFQQKALPEQGASYTIIPRGGDVPFVDFNVGDWVLAPDEHGTSVKRRVMSISVEELESGTPSYAVEFDTIFQDNDDKLSSWLQKLGGGALGGQFANSGGGTSSPIGVPVVTPPATAPVVKLPVAPEGLSSATIGLWSVNGVDAYTEVTIFWEAVTSNTDGSPTTPLLYEVWGHLTENSDNTYERFAVTTDNQATFRPFQTGSEWTFHVRALNTINSPGAYSDSIDVTMTAPNLPMLAPTPPTLASNKGVLIVGWDGELVGPLDPPPQFRYVYAEVATALAGPYTRMGATLSRDGRNIYISGLTIGSEYWVRLIAVDGVNLPSAPSSSVSTTLTGIDLGDLDTSIGDAIDAAHQAGLEARSMNNMLNDPSFELPDDSMWSRETAGVTKVTVNPLSGTHALRIDSSGAEYAASRYGLVLELAPGETYQFGAWVRAVGAGVTEEHGVTLSVEYGADATLGSIEDVAGSPEVGSTYEYFSGTWVVPAGVHYAKPRLVMADTSGVDDYLVDDLTFRMVIPNALIVDGAITADKIGAGEVIAGKLAADSVAAENIQASSITAEKIAAGTITANELAANSVTADQIAAGSVTTLKLSSEVGQELDISSNDSVNIIVGQIDSVTADQNATAGSLETMQTYYQFGPDGAVISSPSSPFAIHIANDRIEMLQLNVPVSYWNAGQMFVNSLVGTEVVLGNHKIEKYGTGTVVRTL
jgi:hypothetical protein